MITSMVPPVPNPLRLDVAPTRSDVASITLDALWAMRPRAMSHVEKREYRRIAKLVVDRGGVTVADARLVALAAKSSAACWYLEREGKKAPLSLPLMDSLRSERDLVRRLLCDLGLAGGCSAAE